MTYQADDQQWLGRKIELAQYRELGLQLLVAIPSQELLGFACLSPPDDWDCDCFGMLLLLWEHGWSSYWPVIEQHIRRVWAVSHFDFNRPSPEFSLLYEAYQLTDVTDDVSQYRMEALSKNSVRYCKLNRRLIPC